MNREIRDEWVRRLRSGEYEQGKRRLRSEEGYCCLGVLCEIAVEHGVIESTRDDEFGAWLYDGDPAGVTSKVGEWSGFPPGLGEYGNNQALYNDNDKGTSFRIIADIIEKYF